MTTNIKYWRKRAKKIAKAEGISGLRFYPTKTPLIYDSVKLSGCYFPYNKVLYFRTDLTGVDKPMYNLLHELAHVLDPRIDKRKGLPRIKQHDAKFQKILSRLNRKYLWKRK